MTRRYFCTLFDRNYLLKGVAMLESLARHCPDHSLFVLCMDDDTFRIIGDLGYEQVVRIRLADLEDDDLRRVKGDRGVAEYCWTLTPCLPTYVFDRFPEVLSLTYLDADLLFFSDVSPVFDEIGDSSISIIEHRFIPRLAHYAINGRFNVEWVTFRRDEEGLKCLSRWREQCIEWCFNRLEEGRMGDQKYLDAWPEVYGSVCIIQHFGAGLAPWNYANYDIGAVDGQLMVDDVPLVFYHFHQFQMLRGGRFDYMANLYTVEKVPPQPVYDAYELALKDVLARVRQRSPGFDFGIQPYAPVLARRLVQRFVPTALKSQVKRWLRT